MNRDQFLSRYTILQPDRWPAGSGQIVLSFDDGPAPVSMRLLDVLKAHQVPAIFCYIGANVTRRPEVVRRARDEGHVIANHTYSHGFGWIGSARRTDWEILRADLALAAALEDASFRTELFRPPYGVMPPAAVQSTEASGRETAYLTFFVNEANTTSQGAPPKLAQIKESILRHHGAAIVLHEMRYMPGGLPGPEKDWLPGAVEDLIVWARAQGFRFTTYDQAPFSS